MTPVLVQLIPALQCCLAITARAQPITITIEAGALGKPISADLIGIFFEDLSGRTWPKP